MITSRYRYPSGSQSFKRLLVLAFLGIGVGCDEAPSTSAAAPGETAFVGSGGCEDCHQSQYDDWRGSHHQLAMQVASGDTVLGDFSGVAFDYYGTRTEFFTRDNRFIMRTDNSNGEQQEFEVTHAFGVAPLQQYLVDFPGGRKQVPTFAWDTRPAESGGQRWYHLYPDEYIGPDDPLHWTGPYFNWNYMCAECHSTNVALNYELEANTFHTTYSEVSVGCEACHGPGSLHVDQAQLGTFDDDHGLQVDLDDKDNAIWVMNATSGIVERTTPNLSKQETESCGRCHARRSIVATNYEYGTTLTNTHMPSLLEENLYHPDGRIQDEVYVYGSFVQSKMYAAGVTCSDCHDPHSGELRAGPNPNDTCSTCHLTTRFASANHSAAQVGDCVSCHMPATDYMGIDDRRDHSFRLPGTSDDPSHYGEILATGRDGNANDRLLQGIANEAFPPIARATMLTLLEPITNANDLPTLLQQLDNPDSLIRIGALRALRMQTPEVRLKHGSHLLRDPVRAVRADAARTYTDVRDLLSLEDSRAFRDAAGEYRDTLTAAAAMPEAALSLAEFESRLGNAAAAARMYEHAIKIGAGSAAVQHAYGLFRVRAGNSSQALAHFEKAVELDPDVSRFAYVYGVALNSLGQPEEAIGVLSEARRNFPRNVDIGWALATIYRDKGDRELARLVATQLKSEYPGDERIDALAESLD